MHSIDTLSALNRHSTDMSYQPNVSNRKPCPSPRISWHQLSLRLTPSSPPDPGPTRSDPGELCLEKPQVSPHFQFFKRNQSEPVRWARVVCEFPWQARDGFRRMARRGQASCGHDPDERWLWWLLCAHQGIFIRRCRSFCLLHLP